MSIPEPATSSALESSNNNGLSGSSEEGQAESSFDISTLQNGNSLGSSKDSGPPRLYVSVTKTQKRTIKVLGARLKNNEEGRKLADELNKNVKLLIERSQRSGEKLTLVKTIAVNGCILFIIELSPPPGSTTREKDVLDMVECLPVHLQHNEMVVTFPDFVAAVKAKTLTEIHIQDLRKKNTRNGTRSVSMRNDLPLQCTAVAESHEVELIEPPCASDEDTNLKIYTRASLDTNQKRVVVEVGNNVIHDQTITTGTSYTKVKVLVKSGSLTGSVRVITTGFQNRPVVSDRAKFLILPKDIAAEFNQTYQTKVMETCRNRDTSPDSITNRSSIWSMTMKPLQGDLEFFLNQDPIEVQRKIQNSRKARDFYVRLIDKIFTFFVEESMWKSLSYFRRQILDQLGLHYDNGRGSQVQLLTSLELDHSLPQEPDFHGELEAKSLEMDSENQLLCSSSEKDDKYSTGHISFNNETNPVLSN